MPSITGDIRNRIRNTIETIDPSVGNVHHFQRWTPDQTELQKIAVDSTTGGIRVWFVTREGSPGQREAPEQADRFPVYVVRGFRAWNDAAESEAEFDGEVEAVQDALGADYQLGGLADFVEEPQVRTIEPRMWAGILCHYAEISLRVHVTKAYELAT